MPYYPASGTHAEPPVGRTAGASRQRPRVSSCSPVYYLGIPAHVWVAAMSRKNGREQHSS